MKNPVYLAIRYQQIQVSVACFPSAAVLLFLVLSVVVPLFVSADSQRTAAIGAAEPNQSPLQVLQYPQTLHHLSYNCKFSKPFRIYSKTGCHKYKSYDCIRHSFRSKSGISCISSTLALSTDLGARNPRVYTIDTRSKLAQYAPAPCIEDTRISCI